MKQIIFFVFVFPMTMAFANSLTQGQQQAIETLQGSLNKLSANLYNKETIRQNLPDVRKGLANAQRQGLILKFEPTQFDDQALTSQLFNYSSTFRAGVKPVIFFNAACMTTVMDECAGPGTQTYKAAMKRQNSSEKKSAVAKSR